MPYNQRSLKKDNSSPEGEFQCDACTICYKTDASTEENLVLNDDQVLIPRCPNCGEYGHANEDDDFIGSFC